MPKLRREDGTLRIAPCVTLHSIGFLLRADNVQPIAPLNDEPKRSILQTAGKGVWFQSFNCGAAILESDGVGQRAGAKYGTGKTRKRSVYM